MVEAEQYTFSLSFCRPLHLLLSNTFTMQLTYELLASKRDNHLHTYLIIIQLTEIKVNMHVINVHNVLLQLSLILLSKRNALNRARVGDHKI